MAIEADNNPIENNNLKYYRDLFQYLGNPRLTQSGHFVYYDIILISCIICEFMDDNDEIFYTHFHAGENFEYVIIDSNNGMMILSKSEDDPYHYLEVDEDDLESEDENDSEENNGEEKD